MATITEITVQSEQKRIARYLRHFNHFTLALFVQDGFVGLACNDETALLLGVHEDLDESIVLKLHHRQFARWVRAAGAHSSLTFRVTADGVTGSCDKLGAMQFAAEPKEGYAVGLVRFGGLQNELSPEVVGAASRITHHCDTGGQRYALLCVQFDERQAVATDGRAMAVVTTDSFDFVQMVPRLAVEWAGDGGFPIVTCEASPLETDEGTAYRYRVHVCGDLVHREVSARFPAWRQVLPSDSDLPNRCVVSAADLRQHVERAVAEVKAGKRDDRPDCIELQIAIRADGAGQVTGRPLPMQATADIDVSLNAALVGRSLPRSGNVTLRFHRDTEDQPANCRPFVLESDSDPTTRVVIMPMSRPKTKSE